MGGRRATCIEVLNQHRFGVFFNRSMYFLYTWLACGSAVGKLGGVGKMVLTGVTVAEPRPAGGQVAAGVVGGGAWQTMSVLSVSGEAVLPKRRPTLTPFGDGGGETIARDEHHRQPKRLSCSLSGHIRYV